MSEFPILKTGAVMQYPASKALSYSTTVMRFLDGSEQRFRQFVSAEKRWIVRLDFLDEEERHALEGFFVSLEGALYDFSFTDPWDGIEYPSCRLENRELACQLLAERRARTELVIKENR